MQFRTATDEQDVRDALNVWLANSDTTYDEVSLEQIVSQWLHYFRHDPDGFWLAEDDQAGRIVGIATSLRRPPQWMLVNFYTHPDYHGQGIGHALLDKALSTHDGCDHFLVHASVHPAAQQSYLRSGMYPQPHGAWLRGKPTTPIMRPSNVTAERCDVETAMPDLNRLDLRALGFTRAVDHRWLATWGAYYLLKADGQTVGYFRVSERGALGPLVTAEARWMPAALDLAILAIMELTQAEHQMLVPGANTAALAQLLRYGYRNVDTELLLSSQPLPDLASAIFYDCDLL